MYSLFLFNVTGTKVASQITPDNTLKQVDLELSDINETLANRCLSRQDRSPSLILGGTGGLPKTPDSNYNSATFSLVNCTC